MIKRIFIANRGDIARRIAQSAVRLGMESVCVSDRKYPPSCLREFVTGIVRVEAENPSLYLDQERMLLIAKESGCDAVHPGFGFLSENGNFARKVQEAGLIWIGPAPSVIELMGDKAEARKVAESAGVPCLQGLGGIRHSPDDLEKVEHFARVCGYPLLIKAAFGGGGKGMRIVRKREELRPSLERAASEALSSFGNDSLIVEQFCESSRHVEVQILGDQHGKVLALGDRDCSLQRRHQKIIEEAPAPFLHPKTRALLQESAVRLAEKVGYYSAGTVEFLLEPGREGDERQQIWFLEMNTRLQVEHPVTEEIFGIDLVAWQLRVACHESLDPSLKDLRPSGHSVEARIYGEDPMREFLPAPGPVRLFRPWQESGVRWEIGLDEVDEISGAFDPMVGRLVTRGESRKEAFALLAESLTRTFFANETNNISFLTWLCRHPRFLSGQFDSHFVAKELPVFQREEEEKLRASEESAGSLLRWLSEQSGSLAAGDGALRSEPEVEDITALAFGNVLQRKSETGDKLILRRQRYYPQEGKDVLIWGEGVLSENSGKFEFLLDRRGRKEKVWLKFQGRMWHLSLGGESRGTGDNSEAFHGQIIAPVPGKVVRQMAEEGESLSEGSPVFILESMKMEFEVKTMISGTIKQVFVRLGEQVDSGQLLAQLDQ